MGTQLYSGACHCGNVRFEAMIDLASARRCTCSYCRMRGAVAVSSEQSDFKLLSGEADLSVYSFNTGEAKHHFCSTCGIYTHHKRRSNPHQFGINASCLEGLSPFDFHEIDVLDGIAHPNDTGVTRKAGVLRFEPSSEPEG